MELTPEQIVPNRPLRVFLCHSSGDKPAVRDLYRRLRTDGFEPWLDEEELLPGQDWHEEIPAAVRACDVVIICLSQKSVSKEGYLQREIRDALYVAEEKPEGTIFIIPVKLEEVEVSRRLSQWQWAKLFEEGGYQRLVRALNVRASAIGAAVAAHEVITGEEAERKAREAEDARLKAEAERKARQEAEARDGEAKGPPSAAEHTVPKRRSVSTPGQIVVQTSPNAEVYFDDQYTGRASAGGWLVVGTAKAGMHELRVSLPGKRDFQQTITVSAGEQLKIAATLAEPGPTPGEVRENPKNGLKYVWIAPGTFMMGCSPGGTDCSADEKPSHRVTISKGFWIGQTEVTVGAYKRFAVATGRKMPGAPGFNKSWANDTMPIVNMSWNDAYDYCKWAGGRLPTEAEWGVRRAGRERRAPLRQSC
jgi:formylglycine-generating enzyme required for sulfatase activity